MQACAQAAPHTRDAPGMGAWSLCRISCTSWLKEELRNGGRPMAASYSTHPRAQRSDALECVEFSENSSGAM